jgi:RNA polymerase sigma factor (sigma-70 family)
MGGTDRILRLQDILKPERAPSHTLSMSLPPSQPPPHHGAGPNLEALLSQHLPGLHAYIRLRAGRMLLAKESAADIVQSACREVLEDRGQVVFDSDGMFRHWLYQAAERKILDRARHWKREKRDAEKEVGSLDEELWTGAYREIRSPSGHAIAREEAERLEAAFAKLPAEAREVIVLSRVVGLSHAEIAAELDRTEGSVRTLLSRSLAKLSALLA